jgi:putative hydrolase of the HAD superfamily
MKLFAVVFDMDDTLYPERDYARSGFRAVAAWAEAHLGIPARLGFVELNDLFEAGIRGGTFDRWLLAHGIHPQEWIHPLVSVYRKHTPALTPFPEVRQVLKALGGRYKLGLLSDGYLETQRLKLDALDLARCFDAIVFSDQWGREAWKPSVRPFLAILKELNLAPNRVVYVADNPRKDFVGPKRLGMPSMWLRWSGGEYTGLEPPTRDHAPDATIACLDQLGAALTKLEERL